MDLDHRPARSAGNYHRADILAKAADEVTYQHHSQLLGTVT
jgi:hypothetical protein